MLSKTKKNQDPEANITANFSLKLTIYLVHATNERSFIHLFSRGENRKAFSDKIPEACEKTVGVGWRNIPV